MSNKIVELEPEAMLPETPKGKSGMSILFWVGFRLMIMSLILVGWVYASLWTARTYESIKGEIQSSYLNYKSELYAWMNVSEKKPDFIMDTPEEKPIDSVSLDNLIEKYAAKHKFSPVVAKAMIEQESNFRTDRIRFEKKWKDQYSKKFPREPWMNEIEHDMYFSSIGIMQVGYGLHKDLCGLKSYTELLFAERNIDCALTILSHCMENNKGIASPSKRIRTCIKSYNGSGPAADEYVESVMTKVEDYLIQSSRNDILVYNTPKELYTKTLN